MMNSFPVLTVAALITAVSACGPNPDDACTTTSKGGACLRLLSIDGFYTPMGAAATSNVDAWRDTCGVALEPEPFTDNHAMLEIANLPPYGYESIPRIGPIVTFDTYRIEFTTNKCVRDASVPSGVIACPELDEINIEGPSVGIAGGEQKSLSLTYFPLRTKAEYQDKLGLPGAFSSYTARFTLNGHDGEGRVRMQGSFEFTVGNFDLCPAEDL